MDLIGSPTGVFQFAGKLNQINIDQSYSIMTNLESVHGKIPISRNLLFLQKKNESRSLEASGKPWSIL